jgi:hypothetical protein
MKRSNIYKATNVTFNPKTLDAHSYSWWRFVAKVEGKVIFNDYRYSVTTAKHQSKVRHLLESLGIKVDIYLQLPKGIDSRPLNELIIEAEETLCDQFLNEEIKKQERYARAKQRKLEKRLEEYLETQVNFRDYDIKPKNMFGVYNTVDVHQCVDAESLERDVENALHNFHRDGFGSVVFYV